LQLGEHRTEGGMGFESRRTGRVLRNERVARAAEDEDPLDDRLLGLLCECGELDCEATLTLPMADYFELRAEHMYAIADDCKARELEPVSAAHPRWVNSPEAS
jgi:hypothetical protein